jgi:hypothetical protein
MVILKMGLFHQRVPRRKNRRRGTLRRWHAATTQPTWWDPGPGSGWKRRKRRRATSRRRGSAYSESDRVLDSRSHNSRVESSTGATAGRGRREGGGRSGLGRLNDKSLRIHDAVIEETEIQSI